LNEVRNIVDRIVQRVESVDHKEAEAVRRELDDFLTRWIHRAENEPQLPYNGKGNNPGLLISADGVVGGAVTSAGMPTLRSMRDVDRVSNIYEIGAR